MPKKDKESKGKPRLGFKPRKEPKECWNCQGTGIKNGKTCSECRGTGEK